MRPEICSRLSQDVGDVQPGRKQQPIPMKHVPDHFKTQEMYEKSVEKDSWLLRHVSDRYKTQEIFEKAIEKDSLNLKYVPNDLSFWRCVKK